MEIKKIRKIKTFIKQAGKANENGRKTRCFQNCEKKV